jgi:hypothetical protein
MGFNEAEKRLRREGVLAFILVGALIMIPGILTNIWSKIKDLTHDQYLPVSLQTIAFVVIFLGAGLWILLGLLKEE